MLTYILKRIGLMVGREWSFPPAFMEEVQRREAGVTAEFVKIGAASMDDPPRYDVIIDRISHEVPYYRTYLKQAVVQGVAVVNNGTQTSASGKAKPSGRTPMMSCGMPFRRMVRPMAAASTPNCRIQSPWPSIATAGEPT